MLVDIFMGLMVLLVIVVIALIASEIRNLFLDYEEFNDIVRVIDKQYVSSYTTTTFIMAGKVTVPQVHHHPEKFNVFVSWNDVDGVIDDEELFDSVKIDDTFEACIHIGYNKAGVRKNSYITLKN